MAIALAGCGTAPTLFDVQLGPNAITPDQDGIEDVTRLNYSVGRPAFVSIVLIGPDDSEDEHVLRDTKRREPGVSYEALFGGVIDGRMLPDGEYVVSIEAIPIDSSAASETMAESHTLLISDADATAPTLEGFTVHPPEFSPNQDGINDRVSISYRLEEAASIRIWIENAEGDYISDILAELESADRPGDPGPHVIDYDAGVDADAPPPDDGEYFIVAEAQDAAGNVSEHRAPLLIQNGGLPNVALVGDVEWSRTLIALGETVHFTATVRNTGDTPVRTRGPAPGTIYSSDTTYNQNAPAEWLIVARGESLRSSVRVPFDAVPALVELAEDGGRIESAGPGAPTLCVQLEQATNTAESRADVFIFESDGDNGRRIQQDENGSYCLDSLAETSAIKRIFARSPGSIRLGLAFDMLESPLDYPFRWQLGTVEDLEICEAETGAYLCLPIKREVRIYGGVRFVEATYGHSGNAHLSLLHEDVRRMHGPYGVRRVTIDFDEPDER